MASQFLPLLQLLNPSPACREAVVPFLCVFLFGLCDSSGVPIQPTSTQCVLIRDTLCPDEWRMAAEFQQLPDCGSFPAEQTPCSATELTSSGSGLNTNDSEIEISDLPNNMSKEEPIQCIDGFYHENSSNLCLPSCHSWIQFSREASTTFDAFIIVAEFTGFVAAVITLLISFIRRGKMFNFPHVLIVYETISALILETFFLVNYMDRASLFCTSMNLLESLLEVAPFCVIAGMVFPYILVHLTIWWIVHTGILFWKVSFPFHSQQTFSDPKRVKYLHISCVIAALVIPLIPLVATMAHFAANLLPGASVFKKGLGFNQVRFPPVLCFSVNPDVAFYSMVLPIDIIAAFGCSLLILVMWNICHKSKHRQSRLNTAEKKLLLLIAYYTLLIAVAFTSHTLGLRNLTDVAAILEYFSCEQIGHDRESPCSCSEFEAINEASFYTLGYVLLGLFPVANLVYAVNIQELKSACSDLKIKYKRQSSHSGSK